MRRVMLLIVTFAVLLPACKAAVDKPRVVVMTDIGGDPDARQSMVRFLLYTCDFDDLPFSNIQRVVFDPLSQALVYVTTFGEGRSCLTKNSNSFLARALGLRGWQDWSKKF